MFLYMATDLFHKYYDNPTKSYIYTNLTCNTADADELSFDIVDSVGQISNNDNVVSSIDLSDVHVGMSQYTSDMKIIDPHSYIYVRGMNFGDTYATKSFGRIFGEIIDSSTYESEDASIWMNKVILFLVIKYQDINTGKRVVESLKLKSTPEITFIDVFNAYTAEKNIPITVVYDDGYLVFTSSKIGYDFWIDHVMLWKSSTDDDIMEKINEWIVDNGLVYKYGWDDEYAEINNIAVSNPYIVKNVYSSVIVKSDYSRLYNLMNCLDTDFNTILEENEVMKVHLFEDFSRYVGPKKYRNGAMLGCVVKVTYPEYNDADITEYQRSIRIGHMVDRVQEFYAIPESLFNGTYMCVRKLIDVVDSYHSEYDHDSYERWSGQYTHINGDDYWIDADEVPQVVPDMFDAWESSSVNYDLQAMSIYKDIEDRECMGIEGYCAYLSKSKNWENLGQFYAKTTVPDDETSECKNLIPSFILYNPNDYPVTVNYLTFGE